MPLAVAEPADPCRQPLVRDPIARHPDPPGERLVLRELLEDRAVGRRDVGRVARQRRPPERAFPLAEQRPDVRRDEPRVGERPLEAAVLRLRTQVVAVVEDLGAGVEERDHPRAVRRHRRPSAARVLGGVRRP